VLGLGTSAVWLPN